MPEFGAAATLEITEVNGVQAAFDRDVTVSMESRTDRRPSQRTRTGAGGAMGGRSLPTLAEDRNEILNEILDVLESGGPPGSGGGGGGDAASLGLPALAMKGGGALLGLGALNEGAERVTNLAGDSVKDLTGFDIGPVANALRTAPGVGFGGEGVITGGAALAGGTAEAVQELQEFQWPEPPDPLESTQWPEYEPLSKTVDWPQLPNLAAETDWPDLPNVDQGFWPDVPNPFSSSGPGGSRGGPEQTAQMKLDGSTPTTPTNVNVDVGDLTDPSRLQREIEDDIKRWIEQQFRP